jgi:hypothetical protein
VIFMAQASCDAAPASAHDVAAASVEAVTAGHSSRLSIERVLSASPAE